MMASQYHPNIQDHLQPHHPHLPSTSSTSPLEPGSGLGSGSGSSSSSLPSSSSSIPISPPQVPINANHYSMLLNNNITDFSKPQLSHLIQTTDHSTILHLAASVSQPDFMDFVLENGGDIIHQQENCNGDLPIHVAAKSCQIEAVRKLVDYVRDTEMLERVNKDGNTALHIALENQQEEMARVLFEKCKKTFYFLNDQKFSPLYLAIKAEFWDLAKEMIDVADYYDEEAAEMLIKGRYVLHAAIIAKKKDLFVSMIDKYNDLLFNMTDEVGRRPLSYAAYTGFLDGVTYLLSKFENEAFKTDNDETTSFPIHSACKGGDIKVIKAFFNKLPGKTRLLPNKKGQNILHVAAGSGKTNIVEFILGHPELEMMINMKDKDGNTPLHLAAKGKHARVVYVLTWDKRVKLGVQNKNGSTALDIVEDYEDQIPSFEERLTWLSLRYAGVPRAPKLHYLNVDIINPTTLNISNPTSGEKPVIRDQQGLLNLIKDHPKMKRKHKYKERINALLVVATLVATVTFASGFTVPGGYNNNMPNEGLATLAHKGFFQVFVISNTIAMYSAILSLVTLIWAHLDDPRLVLVSLDFALPLLGVALAMMAVAFTAALYLVVHNVVLWLGVVVLMMGGMFLVALLILFLPLYSPTTCIRNKILRCVCHFPFMLMLLACEKGKSR